MHPPLNPVRLVALEIRRFLPNGTFRALAVLYLLFFAGAFAFAHLIGENFQMNMNGTVVRPAQDLFTHPKQWQLLAWLGGWFNATLLGIVGVFLVTAEIRHKTLRQGIIFGLTRGETAAARGLFLLLLAASATVVYLGLGTMGALVSGSFSLPPAASLTGFFLQALGGLAFGTLAGVLFRQTTPAVIALLAYVMFIETVLRWTLTLMVAPTRALLFLPDKVLESLAPFPMPEAVGRLAESATAGLPGPLVAAEAIPAAVVYVGLIAFFCYRHLQSADL